MRMLAPGSLIERCHRAGILPENCSKVEIDDTYNSGDPVLIKFTCILTEEMLKKILRADEE